MSKAKQQKVGCICGHRHAKIRGKVHFENCECHGMGRVRQPCTVFIQKSSTAGGIGLQLVFYTDDGVDPKPFRKEALKHIEAALLGDLAGEGMFKVEIERN